MRRHLELLIRPHHQHATYTVCPPAITRGPIVRANAVALSTRLSPAIARSPAALGYRPDPYQDYGRFLTAEGGIRIIFKDIDERFRHTLWRFLAWTIFSAIEGGILYNPNP